MSAEKSNTTKVYKIDTPEDVRILTEHFSKENKEIFEMLGYRLNEYAESGNFLFINWISQAIVNLLKDANSRCEEKILGIDRTKVQ